VTGRAARGSSWNALLVLGAAGASLAAPGSVGAQSPADEVAQEVAREVEERITPVVEALLGALRLPEVTIEARDVGVSDSTLIGLIDRFRDDGIPAVEAEDILDQELEVVRAGGPVGNFGAFVQSRLAAGLRGRALAEAIRAEHRSRGIGIPERRPERALGPRGAGGGGAGPQGPRGAGTPTGRRGGDPAQGRGRGDRPGAGGGGGGLP